MRHVLGKPVMGFHMHKYGLPYNGAAGAFSNNFGPDSIDLMLAAVECHYPKIHVTSIMPEGTILNRYDEGAKVYMLYTGNCDPDIEFANEFSLDDFTEAELKAEERFRSEVMKTPPTIEELNAIQWMIDKTIRSRKE